MAATEIAALKAVIVEKDAEITAKDAEIVSELSSFVHNQLLCLLRAHQAGSQVVLQLCWSLTSGLVLAVLPPANATSVGKRSVT